jgi:nitric oxide reductase subunit B
LAIITYAMPYLRKSEPYNQVLNMISFWLMSSGMAFMTFTLTFAGTIQTHMQRVNGENFMAVLEQLSLFYWMRLGSGLVFVIGAFLFIYAIFGPKRVRS